MSAKVSPINKNSQSMWRGGFRRMLALLAGQHFGGERDLYATFGYPRALDIRNFVDQYDRGDIAGRIVDAYPDATWREPPVVKPKDAEPDTPWQVAFDEFAQNLDLWNTFERLDTLTQLGHYGVLLLGLDGAESTAQPAAQKDYGLLYLTPHGELSATIQEWNTNPRDARYGQPLRYRLESGVEWTGVGGGQRSLDAHWSRVIHVADGALSDRSIGRPRLERIFNRLMDLDKMLGGAAEVYWQNAANLRAWVADADVEWGDDDEKAQMEAQLEELMNGMRRDVRMRGVTPHSLAAAAQGVDAASNVGSLLDMIAGASGIPKRILIGSERGELSSEQDENNWAGRIAERRIQTATPIFVRPFVQRCIDLGVLEQPDGGAFEVEWPESDSLGEEKRATIANTKAQAVATYVNAPAAELVVPPQEFRRWLGEDEESEFAIDLEPGDVADARAAAQPQPAGPLDESNPQVKAQMATQRSLAANSRPRSLYVYRPVRNWREVAAWAKAQGIATTVGEAMHVTLAYSRQPVDWLKAGQAFAMGDSDGSLTVPPGGPRVVERLGPKQQALVLSFASTELCWRHEDIKRTAGASWDYADFAPHVTISYEAAATLDLDALEPYRGALDFGPEVFEEIDDDYREALTENGLRP